MCFLWKYFSLLQKITILIDTIKHDNKLKNKSWALGMGYRKIKWLRKRRKSNENKIYFPELRKYAKIFHLPFQNDAEMWKIILTMNLIINKTRLQLTNQNLMYSLLSSVTNSTASIKILMKIKTKSKVSLREVMHNLFSMVYWINIINHIFIYFLQKHTRFVYRKTDAIKYERLWLTQFWGSTSTFTNMWIKAHIFLYIKYNRHTM